MWAGFLPDLQRLYDSLRGTATFEPIEDQIGFTLKGDGLGHIVLQGFLHDKAGGTNRLSFEIAYDQTMLWHSIAEIGDFLYENPQ